MQNISLRLPCRTCYTRANKQHGHSRRGKSKIGRFWVVHKCCHCVTAKVWLDSNERDTSSWMVWLSQIFSSFLYLSWQSFSGLPRRKPWSVSPYSSRYGGGRKQPRFGQDSSRISHSRIRRKIPAPAPHV